MLKRGASDIHISLRRRQYDACRETRPYGHQLIRILLRREGWIINVKDT